MPKLTAILIGAAVLTCAALTLAQTPTWPEKPIRIVVPFPAGGIADTFGREIGKKLTEAGASRWSSTTAPAPAATSAPTSSPSHRRTATRW